MEASVFLSLSFNFTNGMLNLYHKLCVWLATMNSCTSGKVSNVKKKNLKNVHCIATKYT